MYRWPPRTSCLGCCSQSFALLCVCVFVRYRRLRILKSVMARHPQALPVPPVAVQPGVVAAAVLRVLAAGLAPAAPQRVPPRQPDPGLPPVPGARWAGPQRPAAPARGAAVGLERPRSCAARSQPVRPWRWPAGRHVPLRCSAAQQPGLCRPPPAAERPCVRLPAPPGPPVPPDPAAAVVAPAPASAWRW